jgi:hypothetical protein
MLVLALRCGSSVHWQPRQKSSALAMLSETTRDELAFQDLFEGRESGRRPLRISDEVAGGRYVL